jgi:hypothetical protein
MKNKITLLFVTIIGLLASGCASEKAWVYHANSYAVLDNQSSNTVSVLPFDDARESENDNMVGIYAIPLSPFGYQDLNCPEGESHHANSGLWVNFKPTEDFPKALAEDLRNTHLFADAFFDFRQASGDYCVKGKIINTKYEGRIISYGLSIEGPLLWLLGLPATWTQNELSIEMSLVDVKTKKTIFSKTYTADPRSGCSWIYCMNNDFRYAEMLAVLNKQFCLDVENALSKPQ